jgi:hypothetical protein
VRAAAAVLRSSELRTEAVLYTWRAHCQRSSSRVFVLTAATVAACKRGRGDARAASFVTRNDERSLRGCTFAALARHRALP